MKRQRTIALLLAVGMFLALVGAANAASRTWDGDTNNDWYTNANWNPDGSPAVSDDLTISSGTPAAGVNVNVDGVGSVTINGGDVTWGGRFNTIGNVSPGVSVLITSGSLTVNYNGGSSHKFNVGNATSGALLQQQGGTVTAANANDELFLGNQAAGSGTYEISDGILNAGRIYNGNAGAGKFHIIGDAATINLTGSAGTSYSQNSSSTLELDINGISPIGATGNVSLAGTLDVEFLATPSAGQSFDIINYGGALSGTFAAFDNVVDSPAGPDTVALSIDYGSGSNDTVTLTVLPPPPPSVKINPAELSATANTTYPLRTPMAAVDGSGLDDVDNPTTHTDAGGAYVEHWTSGDYNHGGGVEADEWFVVDLGGQRDLAKMRLWSGFNDRTQTRNPTRRNLERFDLYYANSAGDPGNPLDNPANWTLLLDDQAVPDPDTNNIDIAGTNNDLISILDAGVYNLGGTTATHVGLFDLQNGGQDGWTGRHTAIAEIELFEVSGEIPEPATMAMLGLAFAGLSGYVRRRRRA